MNAKFCAFLLIAAAVAQAQAPRGKVVVISLDGFPAYALEDPKLPVPTLRRLMRNGAHATMTTVNPTVTWPNHTTMVTGVHADRHGLLANGTITRTGGWPPIKVEPYIEKTKMVHAPTVYDAAHGAGLTTAQVDWVAIENAPTITWAFREWPSAEGTLEKEMLAQGAIAPADLEGFTKANIVFRDQIWTRAGEFLIRNHKPDLLLFHLLTLDSEHHTYGPNTLAGRTAIAFLDSCVERLVNAVEAAGLADRTTFVIVSDHGFKAYKSQIRANIALQQAGLGDKAYVMPEGGDGLRLRDRGRADSEGAGRDGRGGGHRPDHRLRRVPRPGAAGSGEGPAVRATAACSQGRVLVLRGHGRAGDGGGAADGRQPRLPGVGPGDECYFHRQRLWGEGAGEAGRGFKPRHRADHRAAAGGEAAVG
jgi:hypothetical protein